MKVDPTNSFDLVKFVQTLFHSSNYSEDEQRAIHKVLEINIRYLRRCPAKLYGSTFTLSLSPLTINHAAAIYAALKTLFPEPNRNGFKHIGEKIYDELNA